MAGAFDNEDQVTVDTSLGSLFSGGQVATGTNLAPGHPGPPGPPGANGMDGEDGDSITVTNVMSGANPGDTSSFDLQPVDPDGNNVGTPQTITIQPGIPGTGSGSSTLMIEDEANSLTSTATTLNFVGSGVMASLDSGIYYRCHCENRWRWWY